MPHTIPYRTGDVLTLKSGGRPMTATWVGPVAFAPGIWLICEWFDDAGEVQQGMFDAATLELVAHV
ncbi:YodC family protein [Paraburkholderia humisilvae]|uniref:YodC family protein n=1 Tax=Paraburkholderia humisilvae TaxID=627669 RepID=UPI001FE3853A|nr:YodC family protein [Paraburkholderia humisilvae]